MLASVLDQPVGTCGIWKVGDLFVATSKLPFGYVSCTIGDEAGLPVFSHEADVYRFCELPDQQAYSGLEALPTTLEGAREIIQSVSHVPLRYIFVFAKGRLDKPQDRIEVCQ